MRINRSIQVLGLIILVMGCSKENDYLHLEDSNIASKPAEELSSTKASACRSSLVFNNTPITRSMPFQAYDGAFAFDGKMYVSEKRDDTSIFYDDWWQSSNGSYWYRVPLPVATRAVRLIPFKNQLWCLEERGSRVWRLPNYSSGPYHPTWELISNDANYENYSAVFFEFNDRIWLVSKTTPDGRVRFKASDNMINWDNVSIVGSLPKRAGATYTVFDNKIWMIGGGKINYSDSDQRYTWYSDDGINWKPVTTGKKWARIDHTTIVYDNKLWVIGGRGKRSSVHHDVWVSKDGLSWAEVTRYNPAPFSARFGHSLVAFKNRLWIFGGKDEGFWGVRDVWNMWKCSNGSFGPAKTK